MPFRRQQIERYKGAMVSTVREHGVNESGRRWGAPARRIASVAIAVHLLAVFSGPWSTPPPSSELSQRVAGTLSPYLFAAHLNHGYRFFAPDPGPSHLVRYELDMPGGETVRGQFPRPDIWPRLLYHRHFMISEMIYNLLQYPPIGDPLLLFRQRGPLLSEPISDEIPPEIRADMVVNRRRAERLVRGVARELVTRHGAERVRLYLALHEIPAPEDMLRGMKLDDPILYHERLLVEWTEQQL
jgi:hypothetical protein